jgi:hypothetical protein
MKENFNPGLKHNTVGIINKLVTVFAFGPAPGYISSALYRDRALARNQFCNW